MAKNKDNDVNIDIAELNNLNTKRAHYSVESTNTKPYDIEKMTGKSSNTNNNSKEE